MNDPSFTHASWDSYTFWQTCYYFTWDAQYRTTLQNAILSAFRNARSDLDDLRKIEQVNPLASKILEWRDTLQTYSRGITCDEGERVKTALESLAASIHEQWVSDQHSLKSGAKKLRQDSKTSKTSPSPQPPTSTTPAKQPSKKAKKTEKDEDEEGLELLLKSGFGQNGHSAQTARSRPSAVREKPKPPPTPEEIWEWAQREMEDDCADTIAFGEHAAAASVLYALNIHNQNGTQERPRKCENTNNDTRIIYVGSRVFWTVGLSHQKRRNAGTFVAYERTGKRQFSHVSGQKHPRDPANV